jgi:tripartite-type tricarboxylate transporter receptor subunit TctC
LIETAKKYLGQPVVIINKGGAGGTLGPSLVAKASPDGYTIGQILISTIISWNMGKLDFNPVDDLTHIMMFTGFTNGIAVRADSKWKSIQEFIDYSKKNPGKVSYATPGVGTSTHLPMEWLAQEAGVKWVHIPYKGVAGAMPALLGGHVDALSSSSAGWEHLVAAGEFRLLALFGAQRIPKYPQVPTIKEIGYNIVFGCPVSIIGPKGIPKPIIQILHDSFKRAMDDPVFQATLEKLSMPIIYRNPEDTRKAWSQESEIVRGLVMKLGLRKAP